MNRKRISAPVYRSALLLIPLIFASCFLLPREEDLLAPPIMQAPEITYRTVPVKRGDIEDSVRVTGYFVYAEQHSVSFKSITGRLRSIDVSFGDIVEEGQVLARLETENLELQIQRMGIQKRKSELSLERKKILNVDRIELEMAELDLQLAQLALDEQVMKKEMSLLRSPMTGEVVYVTNLFEGEYVSSYKTMFQIADRSKLYLSYQGSNLQEFRLGMKVKVIIDKVPFDGEVVMTPAQFPYEAPESQKRQILFEVYGIPPEVEKGDSGTVYLILEKNEQTLIIPRSQVQHYMGRKYVYVLEDGLRAERNIETGIENATEVEVLKGLEEGESIVLR